MWCIGLSEGVVLRDWVRRLADALPSIIKALEDLYLLAVETMIEEDDPTEYEGRTLREREEEKEISMEEAMKILEGRD